MTADVVVIGGGLSGLAASIRLALDGAHVVLVEQHGKLGGRTYSYVDQTTGDVVENGQHVLVGAYRQTLKYLDLIGTRHLLHAVHKLQLTFHHPRKGLGNFELAALPQPLNIAAGMMKFSLLSFNDRQKMLIVGLQLKSWHSHYESKLVSMTVEEWLDLLGQSVEAKRCFWHPIVVSVMNEVPSKASALLFARSIRNTFFGKKSDSVMLIPTVGQSELYVDGAMRLLHRRKAKILLDSEVESILIENDTAAAVKIKNGKTINAGAVIAAVPHYAVGRLLPTRLRRAAPFAHLASLPSSPIVSIHLWFDRPIMDGLYVGLIDKHLQWVFNRRRIMGDKGKPENFISAVISAAHRYVDMKKDDLVRLAVADLKAVFPAAKSATLSHSVVIKEKRATLSPTNDAERHRPSNVTPVRNLFLAGDWTNTGLPPTIEGAVMSGFICADRARNEIRD